MARKTLSIRQKRIRSTSTKKRNMKPWTTAEDSIVKQQIHMNPANLDLCFENASNLLVDRTFRAVRTRWYGNNKGKPTAHRGLRYENQIFFIENVSGAIKYPNTKNIWRTHSAGYVALILNIQP